MVAFWSFVVARNGGASLVGPVTVSVVVTVLSLPASVLGNEAALRYGRHRAITIVMLASAAVALAIGFSASASPLPLLALVLIYGLTVPADSGALTSGTTASAVPAFRGATLALHSTVGFGLSALGAWGARYACGADGPRVFFRHERCGQPLADTARCDTCGRVPDPSEVSINPVNPAIPPARRDPVARGMARPHRLLDPLPTVEVRSG
jgi:hypothetical protein